MSWSYKLGRVAGIDLLIHGTFWILLAWVVLSDVLLGRPLVMAWQELAFLVVLFALVLFHELAHCLVAARFGVATRAIVLLPIGGVSQMEHIPKNPRQEFLIAIAGPALNFLLALLGALLMLASWLQGMAYLAVQTFTALNLMLGLFNVLPAFPMDGGRVLRAGLATRMDYARATRIAGRTGQVLAVLFAVIGLAYNPYLVLIAVFVWVGASREASAVVMQETLRGLPLRAAMVTEFRGLAPGMTLRDAAHELVQTFQEVFPVLSEGHVVGFLSAQALAGGLRRLGPQGTVGQAMQPITRAVADDVPLQDVILSPDHSDDPVLLTRGGHLVGILTPARAQIAADLQNASPGLLSDEPARVGLPTSGPPPQPVVDRPSQPPVQPTRPRASQDL